MPKKNEKENLQIQTGKKHERTTTVWQNGGFSTKFNGSSSMNFCAKLNICASISATSPSCGTLPASITRHNQTTEI